MRQFCVCLFAGLLVLAFLQSGAMANNASSPDECCFKFYQRRIQQSKIDSYIETRPDCNKPGVILVTVKGMRVCANPQMGWVRKTMQHIDDQRM